MGRLDDIIARNKNPKRFGERMTVGIGLGVFVLLLAALAREHWRWVRDPRVAPLGIVGLTLLAGFVVKNLTDDFLHRHSALLFWAMNAMLLGLAQRARREG